MKKRAGRKLIPIETYYHRVLKAIDELRHERGISPNYKEIAERSEVRSMETLFRVIWSLREEGLLQPKYFGTKRTTVLSEKGRQFIEIYGK